MLKKIAEKHFPDGILNEFDQPLAIADENQKIIWYNSKFKLLFGNIRIKGRPFTNIFNSIKSDIENNFKENKPASFFIKEHNADLTIRKLLSGKKTDGYVLKITGITLSEPAADIQNELLESLDLITKEKSLGPLIQKFLKRSITGTSSNLGIIAIHRERRNDDYYVEAQQEKFEQIKDLEKEISSDLVFIRKWLIANKKSLLTSNTPNNLGYNLTRMLRCHSLIISPAFYDNHLLATIIIGKIKNDFESSEIQTVEIFTNLVALTIDLHSTKELNEAIEKRLLQSQKLETIGKLASGMAHDFSNLLASIFGSINLLRKRVPGGEKITKLLDNIESCSIRAKDLIKGLLSFGRPTHDVQELVKPNYLLSEISKVITQTFPKRITFESKIEDNLPDVLGNGTQVYQVLLNLCVNAKESMDDTGKIFLAGRQIIINEENIAEHPQLNKDTYVLVSVEDSGSGISEENLQRIFDPYFSTKKKETGSGSGLGLYVSYGIIKSHGGHIEVSSKLGEGTKFEVFIPAYQPTKKEKFSPSNKIILLAEDEEMLSELLSELLESNGYNVIKVANGVEVLKVLTEEIKVDLAIIDYNMPEMNGIDCIKNIRKLNFNIPIILSSGSLKMQNSPEIDTLDIDEILPKPYEFEKLTKTIQKLI